MVCDTRLRRANQTKQERANDIKRAIEKLVRDLVAGKVKPKMGPNGSIAFQGWSDQDRDGITDNCALRWVLQSSNMLAKAALARAEALAGRKFNTNGGFHSHGDTWHKNH